MNEFVKLEQAEAFVRAQLNLDVRLELLGEGAWSRCFGFCHVNEDLVIRFGKYFSDFQQDRLAYRYNSAALPVPEVRALGEAIDGYYAISTRVHGVPLESLGAADWLTVLPSLVAAFEGLRLADITAYSGFGGWDGAGQAPYSKWSEHLLAVADDNPDRRTYGWRAKLATSTQGQATFDWGFELLQEVVTDEVPRSLVHSDLINRNVLVDKGELAGVFDWGCGLYGDHLYDLAWLEFWSPWYPALDMLAFKSLLEERWREAGCQPKYKDRRLLACYLHIGLDHLAYNAHMEDWSALTATAARMTTLAR